jgi:hypothetical protein
MRRSCATPTATGSRPFAITPQNEIHLKAMPVILTTQDVRGTEKG